MKDSLATDKGETPGERVRNIPISEISDFPDHPFKVRQDEAMVNMVESIRENGVRQPAIIRPMPDGGYQMLSGHRRKAACLAIGLDTIPAVVREMNDDEAIICMVESNHQRENILPSERAFSYKMQLEAENRQGKRNDLTSTPMESTLHFFLIGWIGLADQEAPVLIKPYRLRFLCVIMRLIDDIAVGKAPEFSPIRIGLYQLRWLISRSVGRHLRIHDGRNIPISLLSRAIPVHRRRTSQEEQAAHASPQNHHPAALPCDILFHVFILLSQQV